ncbi:MAG: antibiotic biosynthesis monooxygenase [Bacteroides sp.]|nr:antibiotic biosynthesis monooxygenase [Bacteroides sp.]MBD5290097.1 antibiotic biosynthesis monooxygenase [Bacteroides sp.]
MLRLNCFIRVSAEKKETVLEAAKRLTAASLEQDGCVAYDIFESATRPDVMMICETWRDQAALDAHSASEVFVREVGIMRESAEMKLEVFEF